MSRFTLDLKRLSLSMILLLLMGCATTQIDFDKMENSHINKIALLRVDEPPDSYITMGDDRK